jgi:hypothetical protein
MISFACRSINRPKPWRAGASAVALLVVMLPAAAAQASQAGAASRVTPSGSDASCPAATTAGAGSSRAGAPADVRATGGQSSATVVWCPPATGAGSVVSYTVTSSGGQTVTARVPNDWAIVDGLSNGTGYNFTVTANSRPVPTGSPCPPRSTSAAGRIPSPQAPAR